VLHRVAPGNATELWFSGASGQIGLVRHSDRIEVLVRSSGRTVRLLEDRHFDPLAEMALLVARALKARQWVGAPGMGLLLTTAASLDSLLLVGYGLSGSNRMDDRRGSGRPRGPDNPEPAPASDINETVRNPAARGDSIDLAEQPVIAQEVKMDIEASCNHNCSFCYAKRKRTVIDSDAAFERELAAARAGGASALVLSGGEPLLNPRLVDWISLAKSRGMTRITLETNACLIRDAASARSLAKAGLTTAFVSYHAPDAGLSDLITGTPGNFDATEKGIDFLIAESVELHINCVITKLNMGSLNQLVVRLKRQHSSVRSLTLSFPMPAGDAYQTDIVPRLSDAAGPLAEALLLAEQLGLEVSVPGRCGVPFCVIPGLERFMVDYHLGKVSAGRVMSLQRDHVKVPGCGMCAFDRVCRGIWAGYASLYGTEELTPLSGDRI